MNKSGVLHFSIGKGFGQTITNLAREKAWDDDNYESGVLCLIESLIGITTEQAKEVLNGKKKLLEDVDKQTVGLVKDDFCAPDLEVMRKEAKEICRAINRFESFGHGVCTKWKDLSHKSKIERARLECMELIPFIKNNPRKSLEKAKVIKKYYIEDMLELSEIAGESYLYNLHESNDEKPKSLSEMKKEWVDPMAEIQNMTRTRILMSDLPEEDKLRMIKTAGGISEAIQHGVSMIQDDDCKNDTGFLSPDGIYYGCLQGQHTMLSVKLAYHYYEHGLESSVSKSDGLLDDNGWLRCTGKIWFCEKKPTAAQYKTMERWEKVHGKFQWKHHEGFTVADVKALIRGE